MENRMPWLDDIRMQLGLALALVASLLLATILFATRGHSVLALVLLALAVLAGLLAQGLSRRLQGPATIEPEPSLQSTLTTGGAELSDELDQAMNFELEQLGRSSPASAV